jgi:hypothetical protein
MILDRVTITGADDSINPEDLIPLARDFPFVEWGILFSGSRLGIARYPSRSWIGALAKIVWQVPMKLSAHLCGAWVRDFVQRGKFTWKEDYRRVEMLFARVQLNFRGQVHTKGPGFEIALLEESLRPEGNGRTTRVGKQFILQCDGANDKTLEELLPWFADGMVPIFDKSGGSGVVPKQWPKALPGHYCGYAGGLGPDILTTQLRLIEEAAGPERVWIDMESSVRSDNDQKFDLRKVRAALDKAASWVKK